MATFNEDHRYFDKGYRPEKKEKVANADEFFGAIQLPDPDGYFQGMPEPDPKSAKKRRGRNIFLTKDQKLDVKM